MNRNFYAGVLSLIERDWFTVFDDCLIVLQGLADVFLQAEHTLMSLPVIKAKLTSDTLDSTVNLFSAYFKDTAIFTGNYIAPIAIE